MDNNKFATALKPQRTQAPANTAPPPAMAEALVKRPASRRNAKHIGGYFDPVVGKQLRQIALDEDSSIQTLLAEAIDMIFQSRRKPTIAQKQEEGRA